MIQFNEDEVCRLIRATVHYRDNVTGHEVIWDRYNDVLNKLRCYGEEVSPNDNPIDACPNFEYPD